MSFSRIIISMMSLLLMAILAGALFVSVNNSGYFLEEQLSSHAQDTATALGLSISSHTPRDDMAAVNSMIDAIFDRGYYKYIGIKLNNGEVLYERNLPVNIKNIPHVFMKLIRLQTPEMQAIITSNWQEVGYISVISHPGYAYAELWRNFTGFSILFFMAWIVGTTLIFFIIKGLLRPLKDIEDQAKSICENNFPVLEKMPFCRELKAVVTSMNTMSVKLKRTISEQVGLIESLHSHIATDPVTDIFTKHHFEARLNHMLNTPDEFSEGYLFIIHIEGLKKFNMQQGYSEGDKVLRAVAACIKAACDNLEIEYLLSRSSGPEFLAFIFHTGIPVEILAEKYLSELSQLDYPHKADNTLSYYCGVTQVKGRETVSQLLTQADTALRAVKGTDISSWETFSNVHPSGDHIHGYTSLCKTLQKCLADENILLELSPVVLTSDQRIDHYEILARIKTPDREILPAQSFLCAAEDMGLITELDKAVVQKAIKLAERTGYKAYAYSLNISHVSLSNEDFIDWLADIFKNHNHLKKKFLFETHEHGLPAHINDLLPSLKNLINDGFSFGLDHFGLSTGYFKHLIDLKLSYVKIDGSYSINISRDKQPQFFVKSIAGIAHSLDIKVFATHVREQDDYVIMRDLGMDGIQGDIIAEKWPHLILKSES